MEEPILTAFDRYWRAANYSASTLETYRQVYGKLLRAGLALPPDLTLGAAQQYLTDRMSTGVKASSVAFEAKAIRALAKFAAEFADVPNQLAALKIPKHDEPGPQITATEEDVQKLLRACEGSVRVGRGMRMRNKPPFEVRRDTAIIAMLAATGARRSEIAQLMTEDVDLARGVVTLRTTKTRVPRQVSIEHVVDLLLPYIYEREKHRDRALPDFWLGQAGKLGTQGLGFVVARLARVAELPDGFGCHAFRRKLAIDWLTLGGSQASLQELAGWTSPAMISRYAKARIGTVAIEEQRRLMQHAHPKSAGARARRT